MSTVWAFFKDGFKTLFWDDFREGLIDLRPVGWDVRLLVVAAVLVVLATLAATLAFGGDLVLVREITFVTHGDNPQAFRIPFVALVLATGAFMLGWAYLMMGAGRCKPWVFFPIGALYGLIVFVQTPSTPDLVLVGACLLVAATVASAVFYLVLQVVRRRVGRKSWIGFVEAAWWMGLSFLFLFLTWVGEETDAAIAAALSSAVVVVFVVAAIYWLYISLDVVDMGMGIARWLVGGARMLLPPNPARWLILVFLMTKPLAAFALFSVVPSQTLTLDVIASAVLAVAALVLLPLRRYSSGAAYVLAALSITATITSYALVLALGGSDFTSLFLERTGLATPLLTFVALTLWDLATSGARFANRDGKSLPRGGRMLLYGGGLMLATMATLFYTAADDVRFQDLANNALAVGVGFLGLPYLLFNLWKRREKLIGPRIGEDEGWMRLRQLPGAVWGVAIVVVVGISCCVSAAVLLVGVVTYGS